MTFPTLPVIAAEDSILQQQPDSIQQLVLARMARCEVCPNKRSKTLAGFLIATFMNKPNTEAVCGLCNTALINLLSQPETTCPAAIPHWGPSFQYLYSHANSTRQSC